MQLKRWLPLRRRKESGRCFFERTGLGRRQGSKYWRKVSGARRQGVSMAGGKAKMHLDPNKRLGTQERGPGYLVVLP